MRWSTSDLEPDNRAVAGPEAAFDEPLARIVRNERRPDGLPLRHDHAVAPIRLPAVVQQMDVSQRVPMHMDELGRRTLVDETERHHRAALHRKDWLRADLIRFLAVDSPALPGLARD